MFKGKKKMRYIIRFSHATGRVFSSPLSLRCALAYLFTLKKKDILKLMREGDGPKGRSVLQICVWECVVLWIVCVALCSEEDLLWEAWDLQRS